MCMCCGDDWLCVYVCVVIMIGCVCVVVKTGCVCVLWW